MYHATHFLPDYSLKAYNSFQFDVRARFFAAFQTTEMMQELLEQYQWLPYMPIHILGGGSNILFTRDVDGLVLRNELNGIELVNEDADHYYVKAMAGENWHRFVCYCIEQGYAGLENLSLIPGSVGASPMQNIGAYGVEIKDVFHSLEAWHINEKHKETFTSKTVNLVTGKVFLKKNTEIVLSLPVLPTGSENNPSSKHRMEPLHRSWRKWG